jgi:hypothetical protein
MNPHTISPWCLLYLMAIELCHTGWRWLRRVR